MRTHAPELFYRLDCADASGGNAEQRYGLARHHGWETEIFDDQLGHRTETAVVFRTCKYDSPGMRYRIAKADGIVGVGLTGEGQAQFTGIDGENLHAEGAQFVADDGERAGGVVVGTGEGF